MLARQNIINQAECDQILSGLQTIEREIAEGRFPWREDLEDIHMNVEARLFELIGGAAGRLHTARSRNDQISTDTRLYAKAAATEAARAVRRLQAALV